MKNEFPDLFNTTRLTITFGEVTIGADIEPGVGLIKALEEIIRTQKQIGVEHDDL
jgi:hypothetical protein